MQSIPLLQRTYLLLQRKRVVLEGTEFPAIVDNCSLTSDYSGDI